MAFIQKTTGTRPNNSIPFFEQVSDGKVRAQAIFDEARYALPDLSNVETNTQLEEDPEALSWTTTRAFADYGEFVMFRDMVTALDPTFRDDRTEYYTQAGHTIIMEYKDDSMEEFALMMKISPEGHIYKSFDGAIKEMLPNGVRRFTTPSGEVRIYNLNGTCTIIRTDGTMDEVSLNNAPPIDARPFNLPEGIKEPTFKLF